MAIAVILKNGAERMVRKDELQYMIVTRQVSFFERSDGWVVVGRDRMRDRNTPLAENDRRQHEVFAVGPVE